MIDKREQILARLEQILAALPGMSAASVFRDRGEFDEKKPPPRPLAILLDGSERKINQAVDGRGDAVLPMLMELTPQIFVLPEPKILKDAHLWGPELSLLRVTLLRGIILDDALLAITGSNGAIDYRGMDSDMQTGRPMEGQLQFNFAFRYILRPNDL